ncbi:cuticle protein 8-like [Lycorma delicatula]|uniref:cuticle protein 8-like n=1 Tax=Lycorma delicatula TaxID=130591 RepID=UPI003F515909
MASYQVFLGVAVAVIMISQCLAVEYAPSYHSAPEPYDEHPKYNFEYEVKDEHTGDIKSQQETRDGDYVKGYYSLIQPDGKKRTVEYTSDHKVGFNAIVHYEGGSYGYAPAPAPKYAPAPIPVVKYAAPVIKYAPAPIPVIKYAPAPAPVYKYSEPAAKYSSPSYGAYASASVSTPHFSYKY